MKIFLLLLVVSLVGCVAIPRGTYYMPTNPIGESRSQTCDFNGNKVNLTILLNQNVRLEAHLIPIQNDSLELKFGFLVPKNSRINLSSNTVYISTEKYNSEQYEIIQWGSLILDGGEESLFIGKDEFKHAKQYWNEVIIKNTGQKKVTLNMPHFSISGVDINLEPIIFELKSGELHWFPALNC